ncbi:MAG: hypothetical protein ACR2G3_02510 [Solirubrobacterales bacterium]
MAGDFDSKLRPCLEGLLGADETLTGVCAASRQKGLFSGDAVALGVTSGRLLIQPLDRRGDPAGEALALAPGDIAQVKAEGAGGGWAEVGAAIMDRHAVKLILQTTAGEKHKLMLMRAKGAGVMAKLGGGESQRRGVEALAGWFSRAEGP